MKYAAILAALGLGSAVLLANADAFAQGPGRHGDFMERLRAADKNADGMLSRDEAASLPRILQNFDEIDADHNGFITFDELRAYMSSHRHGHGGFFKKLDKDGDGRISRDEAAAAPRLAQHFDEIDANHDGLLTRDELKAAHQARAQARFSKIDTDGDGRISLAEAQANAPRLAQHFDRVDANHDGFVTPEELKAAFRGHHGHRGSQGQ
ncbi:MAG TPA: EF-hand domain-containing protein [Usitatibacter sp.]|nr:EF-hand domain-containing protein [Usitatibacter sp.]